jgi:hypothetical protein
MRTSPPSLVAVLVAIALSVLAPRRALAQRGACTGTFCRCEPLVSKPCGFDCQAYCCSKYPSFAGCGGAARPASQPAPAPVSTYDPAAAANATAQAAQGLAALAASGKKWNKGKAEDVVQVPNPVRATALAQLESLKQQLGGDNVDKKLGQFFDGHGVSSLSADARVVPLNEGASTPGLLREGTPGPSPSLLAYCRRVGPGLTERRKRLERMEKERVGQLLHLVEEARKDKKEAWDRARKELKDAALEGLSLALESKNNKEAAEGFVKGSADVMEQAWGHLANWTTYDHYKDAKGEEAKRVGEAVTAVYDAIHQHADAKTVHARLMEAERRNEALLSSYLVMLDSGLLETFVGKVFAVAGESAEWEFKLGLYAGKLLLHGFFAGAYLESAHSRQDLDLAEGNLRRARAAYWQEEARIERIERECPKSALVTDAR